MTRDVQGQSLGIEKFFSVHPVIIKVQQVLRIDCFKLKLAY